MVLTCAEQTTYRHSHVGSAGSPTVIVSGGDTNIKGAQVTGKGITVRATNFNIESLQDTADYRSRQQNISAQVTVGYGASASGDYSQSKINAEHRSVSEQSGLFAGDDGFDVQVGGHTRLTGGIITSGQSAEDEGKNRFQTATLTHSDIQNYSRYEGESFGLGANVAVSGKTLGQSAQNKPQDKHLTSVADKNGASSSVGYGSDGDSKNSTTRSGINTRNIHITDKAGQLARTGRTAKETEARIYTGIDTETADQHSGRLKNSFDKDAVAKEINLQREVTQEFGKNAAQATAAVSDKLGNTQSYERYQAAKTLLEAELQNTDSETEKAAIRASLGQVNAYLAENQSRYDTWKEGGIGRSILHGAAGGLTTGNLGGILAGGGTSLAAPYLDKAAENLGPAGKAAVNALGGAAIGYAAGGNVGTAAAGANVDWNNRQLHPDERAWIKQNAKAFAKQENGGKEPTAQQVADAQKRLVHQAVKETDLFWMLTLEKVTDLPAQDFLKKARQTFLNEDGRQQRFFTTEGKQFVRPEVFAPEAQSDLVFYRNNLHSSKNSSITQGAKDLASEFAKKSWKEKIQNPRKTITRGVLNSLPVYIVGSKAVDTFKDVQNCANDFGRCWDNVTEAFQSPGAGTASLILNDLQPIYGQDVRGAQAALIGLQSVENLTTAVGAGKVLKQVVKPGVNSFKRMLDKDARGEAAKKDDPPKPNFDKKTDPPADPQPQETYPKRDANGRYHDKLGRFMSDPGRVAPTLKRPSLRKTIRDSVYDRYIKLPDGSYAEKGNISNIIKPPVHIGHRYGWENRRLIKAADELGMTQSQLNEYVNDPKRTKKLFALQNKAENESHNPMFEKPGNDGLDKIKEDMNDFLKSRSK